MAKDFIALHIRAGDSGAADLINQWLDRHDVAVLDCEDAFGASAFVNYDGADALSLAFVGTDWLTPEEAGVARLIRERWPSAAIVLYGGSVDAVANGDRVRAITCRSLHKLRELLTDSPASVAGVGPTDRPAKKWTPMPTPAADEAAVPDDLVPDVPAAGDNGAHAKGDVPEPIERACEILAEEALLTREELAALLADDNT